MLLLKFCGVSKLNYLARTIRPDAFAAYASLFDHHVIDAAASTLDIQSHIKYNNDVAAYNNSFLPNQNNHDMIHNMLENNVAKQLQLRVSDGGWGLTSYTRMHYLSFFLSYTTCLMLDQQNVFTCANFSAQQAAVIDDVLKYLNNHLFFE